MVRIKESDKIIFPKMLDEGGMPVMARVIDVFEGRVRVQSYGMTCGKAPFVAENAKISTDVSNYDANTRKFMRLYRRSLGSGLFLFPKEILARTDVKDIISAAALNAECRFKTDDTCVWLGSGVISSKWTDYYNYVHGMLTGVYTTEKFLLAPAFYVKTDFLRRTAKGMYEAVADELLRVEDTSKQDLFQALM